MRRWPTWLVVGALAALGALAAADAIRPRDAARDVVSSTATTTGRAPLPSGLLVLAGPGCDPVAVRLPGVVHEEPSTMVDCGGFAWSGDRTLAAACRHGRTTIFGPPGMLRLAGLRGCAPAWRPDGALSVVRDGDLVVARRRGEPRVFVAKATLAQMIGRELRGSYELREVAWMDSGTFAAVVDGSKPWEHAVIVASRDRLELFTPEFGHRISSLRTGPGGYIAYARNTLTREFVLRSRSGRSLAIPRIANAHAIAWSPDVQWVALTTRTSTFIARVGTRRVVMRVPFGGEALEWVD